MSLLIFPTQLFYSSKLKTYIETNQINDIYIIEEPRYFTDFKFHKLKLAYHRASMKKYYAWVKEQISKKIHIHYINYLDVSDKFYTKINTPVVYIDPCDFVLDDKLTRLYKDDQATKLETLNFLVKSSELEHISSIIYKNSRYSHDEFYKYQRKKLNILIKPDGKPEGGSWSFDTENRQGLPADITVPKISKIKHNKYIKEAISYVWDHFPNNYGLLEKSGENFIYPIDRPGSIRWLNNFLKQRLNNFGPYQDAVSSNEYFMFHSVLTPMMNIGLLTDKEVVQISCSYYEKNKKSVKLSSFEGFIRQIIGWRNYVYTVYKLNGQNMKKLNFFAHTNKINGRWWTGTLGIKPIDTIISHIVKYSYAHHIERLMYLGNWMLMTKIDPNEAYRIFMEWTIDAYDWVMVPNIYGMSQYADGGTMMTRPYFSSSNYIDHMSDYKKKKEGEDLAWYEIFDAVYYSFINDNKKIFKKNYAISRQVAHWEKKSKGEQDRLLEIANNYMSKYIR